jgi:hypothetical protein
MGNEITVNGLVRLSYKGSSAAAIYGRLVSVERNEDDSIHAVIIRSLSADKVGTLYFPMVGMDVHGVETTTEAYLN